MVYHLAFGKALHIQMKTFLVKCALLGRQSLKALLETKFIAMNFVLEGHQEQLSSEGLHFPIEKTL